MKTTDERKRKIIESMKGGLIVSCQVQHDDPIYTDDMVYIALVQLLNTIILK